MALHYRTQGFILKKEDRGETDRVFTIYTKDYGKLDLLARAERKIGSKLRGGLELFYLSEVEFIQGKIQKTLTDAILLESFPGLRQNLARLSLAYKISQLADDLIKGQEADEKIWQQLEDVFGKLGSWQPKKLELAIVYYFFLWNLLSLLGYQLELFQCSLCQKKPVPKNLFFSPKEGGLICQDCQNKARTAKPIEADAVKIIRLFLKNDWQTLAKLKVEEKALKSLSTVSQQYLSEVMRQIE